MSPFRKVQQANFAIPIVLFAVLTAGCVSAPKPPEVYSTSGTKSRTLVYPLVDLRADKSPSIADCKPERPMADKKVMASMLSTLHFAVDHELTSGISKDDLDQNNTERLKRIPSAGHHYVALFYLEEFGYRKGFSTFAYKITTYIVRPDTGQIVWKHTYDDWNWQGVVAGPLDATIGSLVGGMIRIYTRSSDASVDMTTCGALHHLARETLRGGPPLPAY